MKKEDGIGEGRKGRTERMVREGNNLLKLETPKTASGPTNVCANVVEE